MRSPFALPIAITILLLGFGGIFSRLSANSGEPAEVSMVALLASPQDYDGRFVRTEGFLCLEFEGNALFLHEEDYRYSITKNSLRIDLSQEQQAHFKNLTLKHVLIEGTVEANKQSIERELYSGYIKDIKRLEIWPATGRR